jgi:hypothetical protein
VLILVVVAAVLSIVGQYIPRVMWWCWLFRELVAVVASCQSIFSVSHFHWNIHPLVGCCHGDALFWGCFKAALSIGSSLLIDVPLDNVPFHFDTVQEKFLKSSNPFPTGLNVDFLIDLSFEWRKCKKTKSILPARFLELSVCRSKVCEVMKSTCNKTFYNIDGVSKIGECIEAY